MMFSMGCHAVWRIFLLKSRLSTLISSFFLLPPVHTFRGFKMARGLLLSLDASRVISRRVFRSNILKKLLYDPVMIALFKSRRKATLTRFQKEYSTPSSLLHRRWPSDQAHGQYRAFPSLMHTFAQFHFWTLALLPLHCFLFQVFPQSPSPATGTQQQSYALFILMGAMWISPLLLYPFISRSIKSRRKQSHCKPLHFSGPSQMKVPSSVLCTCWPWAHTWIHDKKLSWIGKRNPLCECLMQPCRDNSEFLCHIKFACEHSRKNIASENAFLYLTSNEELVCSSPKICAWNWGQVVHFFPVSNTYLCQLKLEKPFPTWQKSHRLLQSQPPHPCHLIGRYTLSSWHTKINDDEENETLLPQHTPLRLY